MPIIQGETVQAMSSQKLLGDTFVNYCYLCHVMGYEKDQMTYLGPTPSLSMSYHTDSESTYRR